MLLVETHSIPHAESRFFSAGVSSVARTILGDPGAVSRGRAKWRDESLQERAEEPLGTKSHRTISKRLCEYRLLIGQKKSLVLFCPIGEQQLSNHFRVFLHGDCCPVILVLFVHQGYACEGNFHFDFPYRS